MLVDGEDDRLPLLRAQLDLTDQLELGQVVGVLELLDLFFWSAIALPVLPDLRRAFFFGVGVPGTEVSALSVFIRPTRPARVKASKLAQVSQSTKVRLIYPAET